MWKDEKRDNHVIYCSQTRSALLESMHTMLNNRSESLSARRKPAFARWTNGRTARLMAICQPLSPTHKHAPGTFLANNSGMNQRTMYVNTLLHRAKLKPSFADRKLSCVPAVHPSLQQVHDGPSMTANDCRRPCRQYDQSRNSAVVS